MGKYRIFAGIAATVFISLTGMVGVVSAHSFRSGDNVSVNQAQPLRESLFVSGRTVDVSSEVFGDVFCAGQTVTISGKIHGDVLCAGQTVNITGEVDGDVRLAGQSITLNSTVVGNATVAGQSFSITKAGKVNGDVTLGSTDATLSGTIGRDLAVGGANVVLSNTVGRDIKGVVEKLHLTSTAKVGGAINYTSSNELTRADGAQVAGTVTRSTPPEEPKSKRGAVFGFSVGWFVYTFLAMLLIAMVLVLLIPGFLHRSSQQAFDHPIKTPLVGFASLFLMPIALVILAMTVIGIPLAISIGLSWLILLTLSGPFFAYFLGRLIMRRTTNAFLIMLVGASVLLVLYFIPILGVFAMIAALLFGSGMILLHLIDRPRPIYVVEPVNTTTPLTTTKETKARSKNNG